jgi:hypothetical protein
MAVCATGLDEIRFSKTSAAHHGNSSINGLIRFLTPKWRAAHYKDFGRRIPLFLYNYHVRGEEIIGNLRLWNRSKNR